LEESGEEICDPFGPLALYLDAHALFARVAAHKMEHESADNDHVLGSVAVFLEMHQAARQNTV
jgi:hypothetical protein